MNNDNNNFSEQLFEAIEKIVDSKIENITTGDKIVACSVIKKVDQTTYQVSYGGLIFNAMAKITDEYSIGSSVRVHIPNNDFSSQDKIIIGEYYKQPIVNLIDTNPMAKMTNHVEFIKEPQITARFLSGGLDNASYEFSFDAALLKENYNRCGLVLGLSTDNGENLKEGDYEIQLDFFQDNLQLNTTSFIFSTQDEEFYTNPYTITIDNLINKVYDISEIPVQLINLIKVTLVTKDNFDISEGQITLSYLKVIFGEDLSRYYNKPITLLSGYGGAQSYSSFGNNLSPIIKALLVNQTTLTVQTELQNGETIRWYEELLGYPGDQFGGFNWKYIDTEDNNLLLDQYQFNENTLTTTIKAIWCDSSEHVIGVSEPITFKNIVSNQITDDISVPFSIIGKKQHAVYNSDETLAYSQSLNYQYRIQLHDNDIEIEKIEWKIENPSEGLIAGFWDEESQTYITQKSYLNSLNTAVTILPRQYFNQASANSSQNIISCVINDNYRASFSMEFELIESQGTNYIFQILPTTSNFLENKVGATQEFLTKLSMKDGTEIPINPKKLKWSWYQYDTYFFEKNDQINIVEGIEQLEGFSEKHYIDLEQTESENKALIKVNRIFDIQNKETEFDIEYEDTGEDTINQLPLYKIVSAPKQRVNCHILQATYLVDVVYKVEKDANETRTIELKAFYPIKIIGENTKIENLQIDGIFQLTWNNEGQLVSVTEEEYEETDILSSYPYILNNHSDALWTISSDQEISQYSLYCDLNKKYYLKLSEDKNYVSEKVVLTATTPDGALLYQQPLVFNLNNFSVDMTNKWAGGVVTIDEEAATIMATAMGAGHKNSDNSFTGVLMGDISLNQQSGIDSGLFGFNNGQMVFKLNKNAEFYVGSDKDNYISFKDNSFDLKTQTLKLNALADNFIIDSTGTSSAKFEQQITTGETTTTQATEVDNAVIAAHNNFIITADGKIYAKNIQGFEMASGGIASFGGATQVINEAGEVSFTFEKIGKDLEDISKALPAIEPLAKVQNNMVENLGTLEEPNYELNIKAGKIGSWSLTKDYLYATDGSGQITALMGANIPADLSTGENAAGTAIIPEFAGMSANNWYLWFKGKNNESGFGVDKAGTLYAKNGIFAGQIEATSGKIGGWDITEDRILYRKQPENQGNNIEYRLICGNGTPHVPEAKNMKWSMWFGSRPQDKDIIPELKFGVTNEGILYAENAVINGDIVATSGRIGNFNIGEVKDYSNTGNITGEAIYTLNGNKVTGFFSGNGISINKPNTLSNGIGADSTVWKLWFGDSTGKGYFGITEDGKLYAEEAHISGRIVATQGTIAGLTLYQKDTSTGLKRGMQYDNGQGAVLMGISPTALLDGYGSINNIELGADTDQSAPEMTNSQWYFLIKNSKDGNGMGIDYGGNLRVNNIYSGTIFCRNIYGGGMIPFTDRVRMSYHMAFANGISISSSGDNMGDDIPEHDYRGLYIDQYGDLYFKNQFDSQSISTISLGYGNPVTASLSFANYSSTEDLNHNRPYVSFGNGGFELGNNKISQCKGNLAVAADGNKMSIAGRWYISSDVIMNTLFTPTYDYNINNGIKPSSLTIEKVWIEARKSTTWSIKTASITLNSTECDTYFKAKGTSYQGYNELYTLIPKKSDTIAGKTWTINVSSFQ